MTGQPLTAITPDAERYLNLEPENRRLLRHALDARDRLRCVVARTPLLSSRQVDSLAGCEVHLKAEMYQRTGSFKFRGAYNRLACLEARKRRPAVVTYSSGNFAQAVALAGKLLGLRVTVVMPSNAPAIKVEAVENYGAEIIFCGSASAERAQIATEFSVERDVTLVDPHDDDDVIAGHATVTLEILEDLADISTLLVPLGGGGLLSGAAVAKLVDPHIRVVGVEPSAMPRMTRSLAAGYPVRVPTKATVMDGQMTSEPGEAVYAIIARLVDDIITVDDVDALSAMRFLYERMKVVAEPSGASAFAALLSGRVEAEGKVAVILSGGNVGLDQMLSMYRAQ